MLSMAVATPRLPTYDVTALCTVAVRTYVHAQLLVANLHDLARPSCGVCRAGAEALAVLSNLHYVLQPFLR